MKCFICNQEIDFKENNHIYENTGDNTVGNRVRVRHKGCEMNELKSKIKEMKDG